MLLAGQACLIVALACAIYGVAASLYGARTRRREYVASGRRAVYAMAGATAVAFAILELAFVNSDFEFAVVASHSSTTTPLFYRLTAMWSSQEGSLLLWLFLLGAWSSLILYLTRHRLRVLAPYAQAVLLGFGTFFAGILVLVESPFSRAPNPVIEGAGLNPLLRDPGMMIHPPMLYSGYTLFAIPFAFAVAALVTRRLDAEWIRSTRPFTLAAWVALGFGIMLGARWSYHELDWGGYWMWDPVENASLMPWLTATAFLHSVMIQERRGMLRIWNVSLVLATGVLAILGTFLVRSGVLQSIHAFGASTLGVPFLILIGVMIAGRSCSSRRARIPCARSTARTRCCRARRSSCSTTCCWSRSVRDLLGTFFPLIAEAVTGRQRAIGPPVYEQFVVPLALLLVLATGIGPVIAWRRATASNLRRNLGKPALVGVLVVAVLVALGVTGSVTALLMFRLAGFVLAGVVQEFWRGVRARRATSGEAVPLAFVSLVRRNRRRYGGYLVHVGIITLFVGVAASSSFKTVHDVALNPGETRAGGTSSRTSSPRRSCTRAQRPARADRVRRRVAGAQATAPCARCTRRRTTSRRRTRRSARCRASSTARRRPRSGSTPACATTSGPRSRPTSSSCATGSPRANRLFDRAADDLSTEQSSESSRSRCAG